MRYCGQLGKERFDREVVPTCTPRYIGQERFYDRADLDAWRQALPVDRLGTPPPPPRCATTWRFRGPRGARSSSLATAIGSLDPESPESRSLV